MFLTTPGKIWRILAHDRRRSAIMLLILTLAGTGLETLGIGLVVPAVGLLTSQKGTQSAPWLTPWLDRLGLKTPAQTIVACMLVLVGVYVIKAVFLAYLAWRQSRFTYEVQADVSERIFATYLRQSWTFHLQHNSAQLLRNVTTEVANLNNVVQAITALTTEGFVVVALAILLVVVEPLGASLVIAALVLAAVSFHRLTRTRLLRWGERRQYHEGLRLQHVQQGLGSVKDVKLLGREEDFIGQYHDETDGYVRVGQRQLTLQQLPRLWLELLAVMSLAVLVLVMVAQGKPLEALVPVLGLFAAAAFRLMPSVVRIMNALQLTRYYLPAVDVLCDELTLPSVPVQTGRRERRRLLSSIEVRNVSFRYPAAHTFALRGVSLTVPFGTSVGFVGASGSGKTTLVDVILGLLSPDEGSLLVDGVSIQTDLRAWQDQIGYVPQSIVLTDDTLRRNIAFGLPVGQIDEAAVRRALHAARLDEFVNGLPQGLETKVGERGVKLSGGQRQRIGIARALYHDPSVLVLDEATSSLDTGTEDAVMDAIKAFRGEKTLLIVAHRMSTVAHCDSLFRFEAGRIVAEGTFEQVMRSEFVSD